MKLFRDYLLPWWEVGLLKLYVFIVGLMVGAYFVDVVSQYYTVLIVVFVVLLVYFSYRLLTGALAANKPAEEISSEM